MVDEITNAKAFIGITKIDPSVERNMQKVQTRDGRQKEEKIEIAVP